MSDAAATHTDTHGHDDHGDHGDHHVVGLGFLTTIFLALMVLTVLTVAAINVDLGPLNIVVALGIALVKALLVVFFFMHIWWDRAFHGLLIAASLGFVTLFIGFTMLDSWQYDYHIEAQDAAGAHDAANLDKYDPPPALMEDDAH